MNQAENEQSHFNELTKQVEDVLARNHITPDCGPREVLRLLLPLDMVLHCPECNYQHVDAEEASWLEALRATGRLGPDDPVPAEVQAAEDKRWKNPPHRSHKCSACGCVWRPADVPTNGVQAISTRGKADTYPREDVWSDWVAPSGVLYVNKNCSECKQAPNMLQGTCCKDEVAGPSLSHIVANPVGGWKR